MIEVRLPVRYPLSSTYPVDANACMIISNQEKYNAWLLNNFIQIVSRCSDRPITYFDFHYRNCPLLYVQKVNKGLINTQKFDQLINFLISAIDNGYYAYLIVNEKHIKAYDKVKNIKHDMLIYGYNSAKHIFYIADAFKNGKYDFETCTFVEVFQAVNNLNKDDNHYMGFNNSIELLSLKEYWDGATFNLERVKESMIDYLECRTTKLWYTQQFDWHKPMSIHWFGLDCYKLINCQLNYSVENKSVSNTAWLSIHIMWEHKNIMLKRLHYLKENKMLGNSENIIDSYLKIERKAAICRNLIIKYTITKEDAIVKSLFDKYKHMEATDKIIMEKIINSILL